MHCIRFDFSEDYNPTITFFLCSKPITAIARFVKNSMINIFFGGFAFLQANNICGIRQQPFVKAFFYGSPDAINVV
jgi:hypothetical protein